MKNTLSEVALCSASGNLLVEFLRRHGAGSPTGEENVVLPGKGYIYRCEVSISGEEVPGSPSINDITAQVVAELEIHWSAPCEKIPSIAFWTGKARVATCHEPSAHCDRKRKSVPRR